MWSGLQQVKEWSPTQPSSDGQLDQETAEVGPRVVAILNTDSNTGEGAGAPVYDFTHPLDRQTSSAGLGLDLVIQPSIADTLSKFT